MKNYMHRLHRTRTKLMRERLMVMSYSHGHDAFTQKHSARSRANHVRLARSRLESSSRVGAPLVLQ